MKIAGLAVAAAIVAGVWATAPAFADDLSYFEKGYAPFAKLPEFVAPGPPFDAAGCMKDKSILSIPVSSANPFITHQLSPAKHFP